MNTLLLLNALGAVLLVALAVCSVPCVVLLVQLWAAIGVRRGSLQATPDPLSSDAAAPPVDVVVLMPAHNEAASLGRTLAPLVPSPAGLRVLVVADNCTDPTADVARQAGADVVERHDPTQRGKGHALQFGVNHLRVCPPEVVLVLDADCQTSPEGLLRLARLCRDLGRPVQGINLMHAPPGSGLGLRVAEFTWMIKTCIRPMGWQRLGAPCQLMGTGFALPWSVAQDLPLASGHIAEDLQLTIRMARDGVTPVWAPVCRVDSWFPTGEAAQAAQRSRWEHGHLQLVLSEGPRALVESLGAGRRALLPIALDLCVPPLSFLVWVLMGLGVAAGGLAWLGGPWVPALWAWGLLVGLALAVGVVWWRWGRHLLTPAELVGIPWFVLKKLGLYRRFFGARHTEWNRADRD